MCIKYFLNFETYVIDIVSAHIYKYVSCIWSAPGPVAVFEAVKAHQRSDNFYKMSVRWKAPTLLQRNSIIKEYVLKHNVTIKSKGVEVSSSKCAYICV